LLYDRADVAVEPAIIRGIQRHGRLLLKLRLLKKRGGEIMLNSRRLLQTIAGILCAFLALPATAQDDPRKDASKTTQQTNDKLFAYLPFDDKTDFEDANRGKLADLPAEMIQPADGALIWDPGKYGFTEEGSEAPGTVNPSLWRQSQLIDISGLFEVVPDGIYQVRNLDLSNMTIIEGDEGITIVDPLVSAETAKIGLDLYSKTRGEKPVKAVIYTHSHVDHYGGVRGVTSDEDVASGKTKIYAPKGFLKAAVAENFFAEQR
jgi:alkyl sulfatase BDS1-like metallo-beta-lactamase superfamily hydrolase